MFAGSPIFLFRSLSTQPPSLFSRQSLYYHLILIMIWLSYLTVSRPISHYPQFLLLLLLFFPVYHRHGISTQLKCCNRLTMGVGWPSKQFTDSIGWLWAWVFRLIVADLGRNELMRQTLCLIKLRWMRKIVLPQNFWERRTLPSVFGNFGIRISMIWDPFPLTFTLHLPSEWLHDCLPFGLPID